jgi:hypothetical protein
MMSQACTALSNLDLSSDDSSNSEEDEKVKRKPDDFTGLCLMGKSSRHISDSDVSDDLSFEGLSFRVIDLRMHYAIRISCFIRFFMRTKN